VIRVQGHVAGLPVEELVAQFVPLGLALLVGLRMTSRRIARSLRRPRHPSIREEP
jgi:hypothetical protein